MKLIKFKDADRQDDDRHTYGCDINCMCNSERGHGVGYGKANGDGLGDGKGFEPRYFTGIKTYEIDKNKAN